MPKANTPKRPYPGRADFSSTEAQNRFGELLGMVRAGTHVVVHRHGKEEAVVVSIDAYRRLEERAGSPLAELEERFDAMVARMREEGAGEALVRALASGPDPLTTRIGPSEG